MYDRRAAFEAFFERVEDGYIFYRHRFARGTSVTEAEHDRMVEAHEDLNDGRTMTAFLLIATALALIGIFGAIALFSEGNSTLAYVLLGTTFAVLMVLVLLRGRSIQEPILGRKPDQPRRDSREFDIAIGRSWGGIGLFWLFFFGFQILITSSRLNDSFSWSDAIFLFISTLGLLFVGRISFRTWRANQAERS